MKFLIIGLGNLGRAIAENLTRIGDEVIGVDLNLHKVEAVKQTISGSVCLDTTDRDALNSLPLNEMDAIFVTYGKNFGTSVQTVALLKSLDAGKLIVRSISPHPRNGDPFYRGIGDYPAGAGLCRHIRFPELVG